MNRSPWQAALLKKVINASPLLREQYEQAIDSWTTKRWVMCELRLRYEIFEVIQMESELRAIERGRSRTLTWTTQSPCPVCKPHWTLWKGCSFKSFWLFLDVVRAKPCVRSKRLILQPGSWEWWDGRKVLDVQYIYDPGSRFATTPPPMVWSQNLRFAAFCMKTWYLQCFLHGGWLERSANLQIRRVSFRKRVICNVSASTSWNSAVAPASMYSMSNYHIILNLLI